MLSFVWSSKYPFLAGSGGSENYTAGQIRELQSRGMAVRVLTLGFGERDGREGFPDIEFKALQSAAELERLDDTLVFVTYPLAVRTKRKSFAILHCPPFSSGQRDPLFNAKGARGKVLIATSRFAGRLWNRELKTIRPLPIVYPFAETVFSRVPRPAKRGHKVRILFAGRLTPDKGIYTLLAALHMPEFEQLDYELSVTTAGNHSPDGRLIERLLRAHPLITLIPARKTPDAVAELMARQDIVVMPSTRIFWEEIFGVTSVEAQHAGCRVVASRAGGLPETDCGGLLLVKPDDPKALAVGVSRAVARGPLSSAERATASRYFGVRHSVNSLLAVLAKYEPAFGRYIDTETAAGGLPGQLSLPWTVPSDFPGAPG